MSSDAGSLQSQHLACELLPNRCKPKVTPSHGTTAPTLNSLPLFAQCLDWWVGRLKGCFERGHQCKHVERSLIFMCCVSSSSADSRLACGVSRLQVVHVFRTDAFQLGSGPPGCHPQNQRQLASSPNRAIRFRARGKPNKATCSFSTCFPTWLLRGREWCRVLGMNLGVPERKGGDGFSWVIPFLIPCLSDQLQKSTPAARRERLDLRSGGPSI